MTVRLRSRHELRRDDPARAAAVLNDDLLAEAGGQALRDQPRREIGASAGLRGDDANDFGRISLTGRVHRTEYRRGSAAYSRHIPWELHSSVCTLVVSLAMLARIRVTGESYTTPRLCPLSL